MSKTEVGACSSSAMIQSPRAILLLAETRAGDVQGAALSGTGALCLAILRVQAADPQLDALRREHQAVVHADFAGKQRAGDHEASALQGETAIDGQTRVA